MEQKKVTVPDILRMKAAGERITMVTAYDCPFARLLDEAGVDILLVGDSLGMVVQGQDTTLPVTLDEMVYHTRMVARGRKRALVLGDLPFGSYQASPRRAVESAVRLVKEGGAEAVKLEGGLAMARTIEAIAAIDVPVVGHVGLGQGRLMQTILEPRTMQAWADATRARGERIALVPTMGALHEGHVALIAEARRRAKRVVVSIFVNPTQFDRYDDFERYPRTLEDDAARCAAVGVDVIFAPNPRAMYPEGFQTAVEVAALTVPLCGKMRPGHFRGVTTVVTKLFHAVRPHLAVFGEKDWQQLAVVRRMAADLDFGIEIVGVPTVREADGLALSSRNRRLTPDDREAARCLPRALDAGAEMVATGETRPAMIVGRAKMEIAACPRARLEYAEVRDPEALEEVDEVTAPVLLGVAGGVGEVRPLDDRLRAPAAGERESARSARAADGPPESREAERESAHASRRGPGASEARSPRSGRALDGPPESFGGRDR